MATSFFLRLETQIHVVLSSTLVLALELGNKTIVIAQATAMLKRSAFLFCNVEEPFVVQARTRALILRQKTCQRSLRTDASIDAALLIFKVIEASIASAVPEAIASSIIGVIEPHGGVVFAWTCLWGKMAMDFGNLTAFEENSLGKMNTIGTATESRGVALALTFRVLGRDAIGTTSKGAIAVMVAFL